ncbi:MAG: hypothetical protein IJ081_03785 [Prevotella sp.]|nr:hypothetical protein [Prevotella sp.]
MNKKLIIPIGLCSVIVVAVIMTCIGPKNKITIDWEKVAVPTLKNDSIELKVYVENSGSMNAYMCPGSNLKDAVFDYVSELKKLTSSTSLYYINSKVIPYKGDLNSYIKDLTPAAFAKAGGSHSNTDLMKIFSDILDSQDDNTVSILVSDCILDIPESATNYFGQCQVSIKNTFNEALEKTPNLGVMIIQLESKFEGFWFCGKNSKKLSDVKRPYYIWVIGNQQYLAAINKKVNVNDIIGGIKNYSAYASSQPIPFTFEKSKSTFKVNHTKKIKVELVTDLSASLQNGLVTKNLGNYKVSNPSQMTILSVQDIDDPNSSYSHVIEFEVTNPETLREENISFAYPYLATWVEAANDSTGTNIDNNINKTTGILSLVKGVAEAYKDHTNYGTISFKLKNK